MRGLQLELELVPVVVDRSRGRRSDPSSSIGIRVVDIDSGGCAGGAGGAGAGRVGHNKVCGRRGRPTQQFGRQPRQTTVSIHGLGHKLCAAADT